VIAVDVGQACMLRMRRFLLNFSAAKPELINKLDGD
jgi:hypothetical protein